MRGEQPGRAQVQRAVGQEVEKAGKQSRQPSGFDPIAGGVLGEAERPRAVGEKRAVALSEMELAGVQLGQMPDQLDGGGPLPPREHANAIKQLHIAEYGRSGEHVVQVEPPANVRLG